MKAATRLAVLGTWLAAAAGCASPGPDASGKVILVQFSPDSRRLVYEDSFYPTFYIYDLSTRKRCAFPGRLVAMDDSMQRFLLCDWYGDKAFSFYLVTVADRGTEAVALPFVAARCPAGYHRVAPQGLFGTKKLAHARMVPYCHHITGRIEQNELWLTIIEAHDRDGPGYRRLRLKPGAAAWEEVESGVCRHDSRNADERQPGGLGCGAACYSPLCRDPKCCTAERRQRGTRTEYLVRSPDGAYIARVQDLDDPWDRLTMTDSAGRKEILLDDTDAPEEVTEIVLTVATSPVVVPAVFIYLLIHPPPP